MTRWTAERVARVVGAAAPGAPEFASVSTDTRTIQPGALFVALSGERFDGHQYLRAALKAGAAGAVVRKGTPPVRKLPFFEVDDTLAALGALARSRRDEITGPVIAITGTNGKTSVKELVAAAVGTGRRVHATVANLNNLVGVPLTILAAPDEADALVIEAGASIPGELARLRDIIAPTISVVTNVAPGHLEGFGSLDGVLAEKTSLLNDVPLALVGVDPPALVTAARRLARRVLSVGLRAGAEVRPEHWALDQAGHPVITFRKHRFEIPLLGAHQAVNAMFALAVAAELSLDLDRLAATFGAVRLPPGRGEILHAGALTVINDAYNANPGSLAAALETVQALRGRRRLVILVGTMLELGPETAAHHERLADAIVAIRPDLIGAVGEFGPAFERRKGELADRLVLAPDADALGKAVAPRLKGDELVLVKASRGVALERAIPHVLSQS